MLLFLACCLVAITGGSCRWLSLLLLVVLWIQPIDTDLTRDTNLTATQLGRSWWLAYVFVVLGRSVVVSDHPPLIRLFLVFSTLLGGHSVIWLLFPACSRAASVGCWLEQTGKCLVCLLVWWIMLFWLSLIHDKDNLTSIKPLFGFV